VFVDYRVESDSRFAAGVGRRRVGFGIDWSRKEKKGDAEWLRRVGRCEEGGARSGSGCRRLEEAEETAQASRICRRMMIQEPPRGYNLRHAKEEEAQMAERAVEAGRGRCLLLGWEDLTRERRGIRRSRGRQEEGSARATSR